MEENLKQLKQRFRGLTDDELVEMVTVGASDYRKEAIDYAHAEIEDRGLDLSERVEEIKESDETETVEETDNTRLDSKGLACLHCGGQMLPGTLVAEKELTIIFDRARVERFVRALACTKCGQLSLVVDLQTDVQS